MVCIDAGHGIETPGKRSPDGTYRECEFALDMARRIEAKLTELGIPCMLTRKDEHDIPLSERCKIANDAKADLFISLHSNASGDDWSSARGRTIYVYKKGYNAEKLATAIDDAMWDCNTRRGIAEGNFAVIRDTTMPAVLIEFDFHTNKDSVKNYLANEEWREKAAEAVKDGVMIYMFGAKFILRDWSDGQVLPVWNSKALTPADWYAKYHFSEAVNLAHFDMATGKTVQYLRTGNVDRAYGGSQQVFGFWGDKVKPFDEIKTLWASGASGGVSGMPCMLWYGQRINAADGKRSRTALAWKDGKFYVIQSTACTSAQLVKYAQEIGVSHMLLVDGGGSTFHMVENTVDFKPEGGRNVPSILYFKKAGKEDDNVKPYINGKSRAPVYDTSKFLNKIGSLDPHEECLELYDGGTYKVVLYSITGTNTMKTGFIKV